MADDAPIAEEEGGTRPSGKGRLGLIGIVAGVAAVCSLLTFGAAYMMFDGGNQAALPPGGGTTGEIDPGGFEGDTQAEVVPLGDFTVNLRASGAAGRLLQMSISVEAKPPASTLVTEREAQLRDAILMAASDFSNLELEGIDGRLRLRDEIYRRINEILTPDGQIKRVYFTSFVVQ